MQSSKQQGCNRVLHEQLGRRLSAQVVREEQLQKEGRSMDQLLLNELDLYWNKAKTIQGLYALNKILSS